MARYYFEDNPELNISPQLVPAPAMQMNAIQPIHGGGMQSQYTFTYKIFLLTGIRVINISVKATSEEMARGKLIELCTRGFMVSSHSTTDFSTLRCELISIKEC